MSKNLKIDSINRIIDANINRLKEGLRVCEEIVRFCLNNRGLTAEIKQIRHQADAIALRFPAKPLLLKERNSQQDIGKNIYGRELKRRNICDIFFANMQRSKESARVLEEFAKLINSGLALKCKELRYKIYETEKKIALKLSDLCNLGRKNSSRKISN